MTGKIALEEHFAIPETIADSTSYAAGTGWSTLEQRLLDRERHRLSEMDTYGIELAILSLNSPGIQGIADPARALDVARLANDRLAESIAKRPDRFAGFGALAMQDPDAATAELTRCIRTLGFVGVMLNGFQETGSDARVIYYDDPAYAGFWARLEELGVPFYMHPREPLPSREPIYDGHPWLLGPVWAFANETAIHALRLMCSGLFDRHPRLTMILGHLGEMIPYNAWRIDHRIAKMPKGIPARQTITAYLRSNVFLTTSGNFRTPTLLAAIAEVGVERILFSVDYPFEDTVDAATWFDAAEIAEGDRVKIGRANAAALFRLKAEAT
jgi:predicted TIM-barrel fold metal-dependent hydrolase